MCRLSDCPKLPTHWKLLSLQLASAANELRVAGGARVQGPSKGLVSKSGAGADEGRGVTLKLRLSK